MAAAPLITPGTPAPSPREEFIRRVKEANRLLDVVGEQVSLRKSGGSNYSGLCPFHSERSPSFTINESKQVFFCHGCKKGGDVLHYVMETAGLSFREALEELAERARLPLPPDWRGSGGGGAPGGAEASADREKRERLSLAYKLQKFAAAFYHQRLAQSPEARAYFERRGVTPELIQEFHLGYAPPEWDALSLHLKAKQAPVEVAAELGLIRPSPRQAGSHFDLFRDRAMFPIFDQRSRIAGFGGRQLQKIEGSPKYLNSSESPVFQKSKLLYGLLQAQKHIREEDAVILVEGYFDVLGMHAGGFKHAVATCGTSLTADHLQLLRKLAAKVIVLFDGDAAGVAATERAMELGLSRGEILHGAELPEGLDPDEVIFGPDGKMRMVGILSNARPLLDAGIRRLMDLAGENPESRSQALKKIAGWLRAFQDPVGRQLRIEGLRRDHAVSPELLRTLGLASEGGGRSGGAPGPARSTQPRRPPPPRASAPVEARTEAERRVVRALMRPDHYPGYLVTLVGALPPEVRLAELFAAPEAGEYFEAAALAGPETDLLTLPGYEKLPASVRPWVAEAQVEVEAEFLRMDLEQATRSLLKAAWARISQRLSRELAAAEAIKDAQLELKLKQSYLDVRRRIQELTQPYDEV